MDQQGELRFTRQPSIVDGAIIAMQTWAAARHIDSVIIKVFNRSGYPVREWHLRIEDFSDERWHAEFVHFFTKLGSSSCRFIVNFRVDTSTKLGQQEKQPNDVFSENACILSTCAFDQMRGKSE